MAEGNFALQYIGLRERHGVADFHQISDQCKRQGYRKNDKQYGPELVGFPGVMHHKVEKNQEKKCDQERNSTQRIGKIETSARNEHEQQQHHW
jgi:hypothetical protein